MNSLHETVKATLIHKSWGRSIVLFSNRGSLLNSIIDSLEISYISGNFSYNDGFFASDKISFSSESYIGSIKVHSLVSSENFDISGKMKLDEFITTPLLNNVIFNSLTGNMEFQWQQNSITNKLSAQIDLYDGLLLKEGFNFISYLFKCIIKRLFCPFFS